MLHLMGSGSNT